MEICSVGSEVERDQQSERERRIERGSGRHVRGAENFWKEKCVDCASFRFCLGGGSADEYLRERNTGIEIMRILRTFYGVIRCCQKQYEFFRRGNDLNECGSGEERSACLVLESTLQLESRGE